MKEHPEIRTFGDPVLTESSSEIAKRDGELKKLVSEMKRIISEAEGVGLAAPQIGVLKRVFVMETKEKKSVFINPRITWKSDEIVEDEEGCLSIPGIRVKVPRNLSVKLEAETLKGERVEVHAEDLLARIFQHEIDHLDGVLVLDRTSKSEKRRVLGELGLLPLIK